MTVLNRGYRTFRKGTASVDRFYAGATQVWPNRTELRYPGIGGVASGSLTNFLATDRRQITIRITATDWDSPLPALPDSFAGMVYASSRFGFRRSGTRTLNLYWYPPVGTPTQSASFVHAPGLFPPNVPIWLRATFGLAECTVEYSFDSGSAEPTVWTLLSATAHRGSLLAMQTNHLMMIGADGVTTRPHNGKIHRVIIRDDPGLATVFDLDETNSLVHSPIGLRPFGLSAMTTPNDPAFAFTIPTTFTWDLSDVPSIVTYQNVGQYGAVALQRGWSFYIQSNTFSVLAEDGTVARSVSMFSAAELAPVLNRRFLLRAVVTPGTPFKIQGSYSFDGGATWTYGSLRDWVGVNSIYNSNSTFTTGGSLLGAMHSFDMRNANGIVARLDTTEFAAGSSAWTDPRGKTWSLPYPVGINQRSVANSGHPVLFVPGVITTVPV